MNVLSSAKFIVRRFLLSAVMALGQLIAEITML